MVTLPPGRKSPLVYHKAPFLGLFFCNFINDLPEAVCSDNTIALYADDSKMFRVTDCTENHFYFQEDLDNLLHGSQLNQMDFNTKKCKIMRITRKKVPFANRVYLRRVDILEEVMDFKDLGVLTNNSLSWNSHIDMISAKSNKMLGLIKRICKDLKDTTTLKTLYCSLGRSNLEYCSVVWSPFTKRNIDKLERILRRATKFFLNPTNPMVFGYVS